MPERGYFTIASVAFPGVYLRMDGSGITTFAGSGAGTVNCQYGAKTWEQFRIERTGEGSVAIASVAFPGVYLRMDGRGVTSFTTHGGGTVNCQYGVRSWERFRIERKADGTVAIASVAFRGVYLRMDGKGINTFLSSGGGTVNCQYGAGLGSGSA